MKTAFKILAILLFINESYGQDLFSVEKENLTIDYLKSQAEDLGVIDNVKSRKLEAIIKLDVFDYFDLNRQYDTELKKKVFKESEEYNDYLEKMETEKSKIENSYYFVRINPLFRGHAYHKGEYDLKAKGFFIKTCWSNDYDFKHKIDKNYFYFKTFPSKVKSETFYGTTSTWEEFFVPISESDAIKIESNPKNYSYLIIFKIDGVEKINWDNEFTDGTITLPKSEKLRLLIMENDTEKIYFDKIY